MSVSTFRGAMESRKVATIFQVCPPARTEQQLEHSSVSVICSAVHCSAALVACPIHIRTALKQQPDAFSVTTICSPVERRPEVIRYVRVPTTLQQHLEHLRLSKGPQSGIWARRRWLSQLSAARCHKSRRWCLLLAMSRRRRVCIAHPRRRPLPRRQAGLSSMAQLPSP